MRLHSTPESVERGEITALAIIECVISAGIYFALCRWWHSLLPFAISICFAPLFLFRTDISYDMSLKNHERIIIKFEHLFNFIEKKLPFSFPLIAVTVFFPFIVIINRFYCTTYCAITRPIITVKNIPENNLRNSCVIDAFFPPEMTPGENKLDRYLNFHDITVKFFDYIKGFKFNADSIVTLIAYSIFIYMPLIVFGYIPAFVTRISFKASALIYLPLVFLVQSTLGRTSGLKVWLKELLDGKLELARRWISGVLLTLAAIKLALAEGQLPMAATAEYTKQFAFLNTLVSEPAWHPWEAMVMVEAALTYGLWVFADKALIRIDAGEAWPEEWVATALQVVTFTRGAIAAAAVMAGFGSALIVVARHFLT